MVLGGTIRDFKDREELKAQIIKNRKHNDEYLLRSESNRRMENLAIAVRTHLEGFPSRMASEFNSPKMENKVYDFCVRDLQDLYKSIERLA